MRHVRHPVQSPSATLGVLLDDPAEQDFASAERLLSGLSGEQAVTVPPGLPYSIAAILAHMNANVRFNLGLIRSPDPATFGNPCENWPTVSREMWPELVAEFLAGVAELGHVAREENLGRVLYPSTGEEPAWTVGYKLAVSRSITTSTTPVRNASKSRRTRETPVSTVYLP